jgi:hypothetical protein
MKRGLSRAYSLEVLAPQLNPEVRECEADWPQEDAGPDHGRRAPPGHSRDGSRGIGCPTSRVTNFTATTTTPLAQGAAARDRSSHHRQLAPYCVEPVASRHCRFCPARHSIGCPGPPGCVALGSLALVRMARLGMAQLEVSQAGQLETRDVRPGPHRRAIRFPRRVTRGSGTVCHHRGLTEY